MYNKLFNGLKEMGMFSEDTFLEQWNKTFERRKYKEVRKNPKVAAKLKGMTVEEYERQYGLPSFCRLTWTGTLGELGYMATRVYGVDRWEIIRKYYQLPNGQRVNIRSLMSIVSRYSDEVYKYQHIMSLIKKCAKKSR